MCSTCVSYCVGLVLRVRFAKIKNILNYCDSVSADISYVEIVSKQINLLHTFYSNVTQIFHNPIHSTKLVIADIAIMLCQAFN